MDFGREGGFRPLDEPRRRDEGEGVAEEDDLEDRRAALGAGFHQGGQDRHAGHGHDPKRDAQAIPLQGRVGDEASYQYAARGTVRPLDDLTVGLAWSNRHFARLAADHSDSGSKANGGLVGPLSKSDLSDELQKAKNNVALGLPGQFETTQGVATQLAQLELYGLPADYFNRFVPHVLAVTDGDVHRVAREYIDPENVAIFVGSAFVFALALFLARSQTTVDDVSWMKAMIPHHSIAILTSERAQITDPRTRDLADQIIESQRREIEEMKVLIQELEGR